MARSTARDVAECIIELCNRHGDTITNLKLQKLLYYAQAWYLALNDVVLFDEHFEAWVHGPVQPGVYRTYKDFGYQPISREFQIRVATDVCAHVVEVMKSYGGLSAFDLERLTHDEDPWRVARGELAPDENCTNIIDTELMRTYYKGKLVGQR